MPSAGAPGGTRRARRPRRGASEHGGGRPTATPDAPATPEAPDRGALHRAGLARHPDPRRTHRHAPLSMDMYLPALPEVTRTLRAPLPPSSSR